MLSSVLSALPLICVVFWLAVTLLDSDRCKVKHRSVFYLLFAELLIFHLIILLEVNTPECLNGYGLLALYFADALFTPMLFPILNFFVKSLVHKDVHGFGKSEWLQLIPAFVLASLTLGAQIYLSSKYEISQFDHLITPFNDGVEVMLNEPIIFVVFVLFYVVLIPQAIGTAIYAFTSISRYSKELAEEVADFDVNKYFNMKRVLICVGLLASWGLIRYTVIFLDPNDSTVWAVYGLVHTILLFVGCNWFVQIYFTADDFTVSDAYHAPVQELPAPMTSAADDRLQAKIGAWVAREDKPYLKNGLKIADMASDIKESARLLSMYINKTYGVSFNIWINRFRIDYAKQLMKQDGQISIVELAFQCGFCDAASFSHMFKKLEGETPKQWLQKSV